MKSREFPVKILEFLAKHKGGGYLATELRKNPPPFVSGRRILVFQAQGGVLANLWYRRKKINYFYFIFVQVATEGGGNRSSENRPPPKWGPWGFFVSSYKNPTILALRA